MSDLASLYIKVDSSGVVTASKDLDKLTGHSRKAEKATDSLSAGFGRLKGMVAGLATAYAGLQLARFVTDVVQAQVTMERMTVALKSATGSAQAAAEGMAYVRSESQRLGLSLQDQGKAYTKLAAASKGTSLEGKATQDIFTAISEASTALSLSADESAGALYAIGQMMSKGTVQAEELRGQLGERLPGAFQVAAKAMGVSTAELGKMLEQGKVMSDDFLPKFAAALRQHYAGAIADASQSTSANLNRMKTAIFEAKVALGQAFGSATQDSVKSMTSAVEKMKAEMETPEAKRAISELSAEFAKLIENAGTKAPDAIRSTIEALNGIMTFYNSLPSDLVGAGAAGLVGKLLFNNQIGWILASITLIDSKLQRWSGSGILSGLKNLWSGYGWNGDYADKKQIKYTGGAVGLPENVNIPQAPDLDKMIAGLGPNYDIEKAKTSIPRTGTNSAAKKAADELKKLQEQWDKTAETTNFETLISGLDDYEKQVEEIYSKVAEKQAELSKAYKEGTAEYKAGMESIASWQESQETTAINKWMEEDAQKQIEAAAKYEATMKAAQDSVKKGYDEIHTAQIASINAQLYELDLAEQGGKSWRDLINERIRLTQQLLDIETAKLASMPPDATNDDYRAQLKSVQELQAKMIQFKNLNQQITGTFSEGWNKAWQGWTDSALTMFTAGQQMALDTAQAMEDAFSTYFFDIIEGRFNSLSDILKSFSHAINQALANALGNMATNYVYNGLNSGLSSLIGAGVSMLGSVGGGSSTPSGYTDSGSGYSSTSSFGTGSGSTFGNWTYNALGNAFMGGNVLAFANGGIVNRPTFFPMANGTGLMGEAGPEAVMPLQRTKSGKLGVAMEGGGTQGVMISNKITIHAQGKISPADISDLDGRIEDVCDKWARSRF